MTAREVLLAAADHIERYGWKRGERGSAGHPCCVLGALGVGSGYDRLGGFAEDYDSRLAEVQYALYLKTVDSLRIHLHLLKPGYIAHWNDAPERTATEVTAALRAAAEGTAP